MPERVRLKRIDKHFDHLKYNLVIYYHNELSIKDIYNKVIKKEKSLKHYEPETRDWNESLLIVDDNGTSFLILNEEVNISVIQHEVIHIVTAIFEFIGSAHNDSTDELYAYNAQHIFEFIIRTMVDKWNVPIDKLMNF